MTVQSTDSMNPSDMGAGELFARFKAASGGACWDAVHSLHQRGTLAIGGLSGEYHATHDLRSGRSASRHALGPMQGAAGYDGHAAWQRGPGGEIAQLDAPEAKRRARSQAWLDARAYWYPQRMPARFGEIGTEAIDGRNHRVIEVTADGADPLTLWFSADTNLLARIVRRRGADTVTTALDDYREVAGLLLPFRAVTDRIDASGRIDPRLRMQIVLDEVTPNLGVVEADFALPAMAPVARIEDASGSTQIPFDLANNHIYVDAVIDDQPVRLMVDTGGMNLLTPATAARLGLHSEGRLGASGPGAQRPDVALARARHVRVGAAVLDDPIFYVVDLGELPQAEGVVLEGLLGYEMFRRFGVQIDYAMGRLSLCQPERFVPPPNATAIEFEFDRLTPIVSGVLDGVPVRLAVDTGSRASLSMHSPFVHARDLVAKYTAAPECVLGWGVGGAVRMRAARFGRLQLGGLDIVGIAGDLFTGTGGAMTNPDHAGNLGGGVLKRFTVAFDYAARRMHLAPNDAFGGAEAFDRSGLWLVEEGEALNVVDVAPGSAAERAGLRENDSILTIAGEGIAAHALPEWRRRLRELPAGTRVAIRVLRDASIVDTQLVLADRIAATWNG